MAESLDEMIRNIEGDLVLTHIVPRPHESDGWVKANFIYLANKKEFHSANPSFPVSAEQINEMESRGQIKRVVSFQTLHPNQTVYVSSNGEYFLADMNNPINDKNKKVIYRRIK